MIKTMFRRCSNVIKLPTISKELKRNRSVLNPLLTLWLLLLGIPVYLHVFDMHPYVYVCVYVLKNICISYIYMHIPCIIFLFICFFSVPSCIHSKYFEKVFRTAFTPCTFHIITIGSNHKIVHIKSVTLTMNSYWPFESDLDIFRNCRRGNSLMMMALVNLGIIWSKAPKTKHVVTLYKF